MWLGHEPSWKAIADRRLKFGTSKFKVSLVYGSDFGVTAELSAGLKGVGVKLGGAFAKFETTEWYFEGEFADVT